MPLPTLTKSESGVRPWMASVLGFAVSIPWCCMVPALFASFGLGAVAAGRWLGVATPLFLGLGGVLFARAHYLLWVKRHGAPAARALTVILTILAVALWVVRLS